MKINNGQEELVKIKKGDRGLYARLSDGQIAFPEKNSELKEGHACVKVVKRFEKYSLINGKNLF